MDEMVADLTEARGKCTRQLAQTAIKNAKFLSNRAEIARYIARTASQSVRVAAAKR